MGCAFAIVVAFEDLSAGPGAWLLQRNKMSGKLQQAVDAFIINNEPADTVILALYNELKDDSDIKAFTNTSASNAARCSPSQLRLQCEVDWLISSWIHGLF